jgi:hypothetical protein
MSSPDFGSDLAKAYGNTTLSLVKPDVSNLTAKTTGGRRKTYRKKEGGKKKSNKRKKGGNKKKTEKRKKR